MKSTSKKTISTLLAAALLLSLLSAMPLTASAAGDPFQVTEQPVGADYLLGATPDALKATFNYITRVQGYVDPKTPIIVQWYWSYEDTNTGRTNGLGSATLPYDGEPTMTYSTTQLPSTDAVGVKYYYAVLSYGEYVYPTATVALETIIPREAVSDTARVEVTAPPVRIQRFTVKKVDEEGNPLEGATIRLAGTNDDGSPKIDDQVTGSGGTVLFSVSPGSYVLSEYAAPEGYTGSDKTYNIEVNASGIYSDEFPDKQYETVVFVNTKIPPPETPPETPPPETPPPSKHSFTVKKTDENGNPLAGATIRLEGMKDDGNPLVLDIVTNNSGEALFTVDEGSYILSEYTAPTGYNATDETYSISIIADGVFTKNSTNALVAYSQVVFVNKKIPELNKDDHNFPYMQGYPDGTFRPGRNMSRAEAVVMFSRLLTEVMDLTTDYRLNCYPDVDVTNPWRGADTAPWYANQVCYMYRKGVLADYSRDSNFRPNDPVTRAEFATLAAHFDNLVLTDTNAFPDVPSSHWAVKYINSAAAKGWIVGYPDGTFGPENYITRAEVVTLVNRMLNRKGDEAYLTAHADSLPRTYTDLPTGHWAYLDIMEASLGHNYNRVGSDEQWTSAHR